MTSHLHLYLDDECLSQGDILHRFEKLHENARKNFFDNKEAFVLSSIEVNRCFYDPKPKKKWRQQKKDTSWLLFNEVLTLVKAHCMTLEKIQLDTAQAGLFPETNRQLNRLLNTIRRCRKLNVLRLSALSDGHHQHLPLEGPAWLRAFDRSQSNAPYTLQELHLKGFDLSDVAENVEETLVPALRSTQSLQHLALESCPMTDRGLLSLVKGALENLCTPSPAGYPRRDGLKHFRVLNLPNDSLSSISLSTLTLLLETQNCTLVDLQVEGGFDNAGVFAPRPIPGLKLKKKRRWFRSARQNKLRKMHIDQKEQRKRSLLAFAATISPTKNVMSDSSLRELHLCNCGLDDKDLRQLLKVLSCENEENSRGISLLNLNGNPSITRKVGFDSYLAKALPHLNTLSKLYMKGLQEDTDVKRSKNTSAWTDMEMRGTFEQFACSLEKNKTLLVLSLGQYNSPQYNNSMSASRDMTLDVDTKHPPRIEKILKRNAALQDLYTTIPTLKSKQKTILKEAGRRKQLQQKQQKQQKQQHQQQQQKQKKPQPSTSTPPPMETVEEDAEVQWELPLSPHSDNCTNCILVVRGHDDGYDEKQKQSTKPPAKVREDRNDILADPNITDVLVQGLCGNESSTIPFSNY